jgi:hypothetical protein
MVRMTVPMPRTGMDASLAISINMPCTGVYVRKYVFLQKK